MADSNAERSLLDYLQQQQDTTVAEIKNEAETTARHMRQQALLSSRRRIAHVIKEERDWQSQQLVRAQSGQEARQKHAEREQLGELSELAWQGLQLALKQLWKEPATQAAWITAAVIQASEVFSLKEITLRLPEDVTLEIQLKTSLENRLDIELESETDATLQVGTKISQGNIVLDASLEGLLSDNDALRGRLMQLLKTGLRQQGIGEFS